MVSMIIITIEMLTAASTTIDKKKERKVESK
jgi:hypothetical protein